MTYQRRRIKKTPPPLEVERDKLAQPQKRRRRLPFGECPSCDRYGQHGPSHDASPRCESGSRPHCTCDTCF
jgi:hypothetical protein